MGESVNIKIKDKQYVIRGSDDRDQILKVAQYVDNKIREITDSTTGLSDEKTAVLAALDITGDYFQIEKEKENLLTEINDRSQELLKRLDYILT